MDKFLEWIEHHGMAFMIAAVIFWVMFYATLIVVAYHFISKAW